MDKSRRNFLKISGAILAGNFLVNNFVYSFIKKDLPHKFAVLADPHVCVYKKQPNVKNTVKMYHYNEKIFKDIINTLTKQNLDALFIVGDLTKDSEPWNHERVLDILSEIHIPWFVVPGNHDVYKTYMKEYWTLNEFIKNYHPHLFKNRSYYSIKIAPHILLIGLNTNDPEEDLVNTWGGYISNSQLEWLNRILMDSKESLIIILTHHALFDHPSPWDRKGMNPNFKVLNANKVLKILKTYTNKHNIIILCGHIHMTHIVKKEGIIEIVCPATCSYPLAYRIIEVSKDTNIINVKTMWYSNKKLREIALNEAIKAGWTQKDINEAEGLLPWDRNITIGF